MKPKKSSTPDRWFNSNNLLSAAFATVRLGQDHSEMQAPGGPSPGQTCVLILIFTVLLQSLCVAVTYMYFTRELKQVSTMHTVPDRGAQPPWGGGGNCLCFLFWEKKKSSLSLPVDPKC